MPNGTGPLNDENARPVSQGAEVSSPYNKDKPSIALNVKERKQEPNEFKLSCMQHPMPPHCDTTANISLSGQ